MDKGNFRRSQASEIGKSKKQRFKFVPKPVKRVWRRYNLTRILLLGVTIVLIFVTGYLYFLSKVANVGVLEQ